MECWIITVLIFIISRETLDATLNPDICTTRMWVKKKSLSFFRQSWKGSYFSVLFFYSSTDLRDSEPKSPHLHNSQSPVVNSNVPWGRGNWISNNSTWVSNNPVVPRLRWRNELSWENCCLEIYKKNEYTTGVFLDQLDQLLDLQINKWMNKYIYKNTHIHIYTVVMY